MGSYITKPSEFRESILRERFNSSVTPESFIETEKSLTICERLYFGYIHKVWKIAHLYKFMMEERTNIGYRADDLICKFTDIETEIIDGYEENKEWAIEAMNILAEVVGDKKYKKLPDVRVNTIHIV